MAEEIILDTRISGFTIAQEKAMIALGIERGVVIKRDTPYDNLRYKWDGVMEKHKIWEELYGIHEPSSQN